MTKIVIKTGRKQSNTSLMKCYAMQSGERVYAEIKPGVTHSNKEAEQIAKSKVEHEFGAIKKVIF